MKEIVKELVRKNKEGDYWDFKEKFPDNNADFLHDILCMSNSLSNSNRYLIYGIAQDKTKFKIVGVENNSARKTQ